MQKTPEENGFLSRWSSRKLKKTDQPAPASDDSAIDAKQSDIAVENTPEASPEPASEQAAWQNPELDPANRRQALRDIFQKPGIGLPDGLDEYERDYNYHNFAKLGDVVTHEMCRLLEKQAEQLAAAAEAEPDNQSATKPDTPESEDNKLA